MGSVLRKTMLATVVVVALVGIVSALASAATKTTINFVSPSPAEGEELSTNAVEFKFTYNKKPSATGTLECALAGPTPSSGDCDDPVASGKKGSQSGASYSGLANGFYTLTVSLTLTDGGTASATRSFTVAVVPTNEIQLVRVSGPSSGTFTLTFSGQTTDPLPADASAAQVDVALEALSNIGVGDVSVTGGPVNFEVVIEFTGALAGTNVPPLTGSGSGGAVVHVATTQEGG